LAQEVDKLDTSKLPLSEDNKKKVEDVKKTISDLAKKL
jgi:hypothetical protein